MFDAATNTASFPDGTVVTFVDKDHAKLRWPAGYGVYQDFELAYHGASTGGLCGVLRGAIKGLWGSRLGGAA